MSVVIDGTTGITSPTIDLTTPLVAADGGTGLSSVGTAGNVLTSNGTAWTSSAVATPATMTLLGTITPTAVNSINLPSLTLTSYKALFIAFNNINTSDAKPVIYINQTSVQTGGGVSSNTTGPLYGTAWLDLNTGVIGGAITAATIPAPTGAGETVIGGLTTVTTASTVIHFRNSSTSTFTAAGSIRIYGVT